MFFYCLNVFLIFSGKASTIDRYPLIISNRFNLPFLLGKKGIGKVDFLLNLKILHLSHYYKVTIKPKSRVTG